MIWPITLDILVSNLCIHASYYFSLEGYMMHNYRSHTCADLKIEDVGSNVRLSGWVHRVRDHGGVLFIDLRDHYGVTQVLCDPDSPVFSQVENVRSEWCIRIDGEVKARDPELINTKISTGGIEVFVRDIEVLGASAELPLMVLAIKSILRRQGFVTDTWTYAVK